MENIRNKMEAALEQSKMANGAITALVSIKVSTTMEVAALRVHPIRLLLILPPTQDEYDRIRAETRPFFPKPLPMDLQNPA